MSDKVYPQENFLIFEGNLGEDPELKYWESGTAYCIIDVANNRDFLNKDGEKIERTNWSRVKTIGKQAEAIAEYMKKGSRVMVFGELEQRKWKNDDGDNRSMLQITTAKPGGHVKFMDPKNGNGGNGGRMDEPPDMDEDDIPF